MLSISDKYDYKNICKLAAIDDNVFNSFKSNSNYNAILEHVSYEQGLLYLNYLNLYFPEFNKYINDFQKNDIFGGTKTYYYENIGNISPSTLRYIKVLFDIIYIFGDLNNKKIIEIGSGYGGQCFILNQYFKNIKNYTLVDLDEALSLSNKYLSKLNINHEILKIENIENLNESFDLVISNYAYSELTKELQDNYYDNIIRKSQHGYFTLNFISHIENIQSYSLEEIKNKFIDKEIQIIDENPQTYSNNVILIF